MNEQQRAVVQQALEALEKARSRITVAGGSGWKLEAQRCVNAISALRKLLEQPEPVQEPDADALDGDIGLFDDARAILEIIVHDQPADLFRDARALIPKLRARIGMPPIINFTTPPAQPAPVQEPFAWCVDSENSADWAIAKTKEGVEVNAKLMDAECIKTVPFPLYTTPPAAPVQEPVAFLHWYDNAHWGNEDFKEGCHRSWDAAIKYATSPAQQAAQTDLADLIAGELKVSRGTAYDLMREALKEAYPVEPVAWVCYGAPGKRDIDFEEADINGLPIGTLLYTAQPVAQPEMYGDWDDADSCGQCGMVNGHSHECRHNHKTPAQPEPVVMKQAYRTSDAYSIGFKDGQAAPVQEPVAWMPETSAPKTGERFLAMDINDVIQEVEFSGVVVGDRPFWRNPYHYGNVHIKKWLPLSCIRTAPQPAAWVGLTDDEIAALDYLVEATGYCSDSLGVEGTQDFARAVEAKLREKNGGTP